MFDSDLQIDKDTSVPRYAQIQSRLRDMVIQGHLKPGEKIPSEVQIAGALGVSRMTINKAVVALTSEGFFVRGVGRGTFVAALPPAVAQMLRPAASDTDDSRRRRVVLSLPIGTRDILDSSYYSSIYHGITDLMEAQAGSSHTVDLQIASVVTGDYFAEEARLPAEGRIIVAPRENTLSSIERLWNAGHALVIIGASWPTVNVPTVDSDNVSGAMAAVDHLIGLGHTRIALLLAEKETANSQDRVFGYRRALAMANLPHSPEWEVYAATSWRAGAEAKARLGALARSGSAPITAIFAGGYHLALEAMNAVRDVGLRIPEEVSIVGFDDPSFAELVYPPLTTIRQPLYEMGRRTMERLLHIIRGVEQRAPIREIFPTQLVVRESTAPVHPNRRENRVDSPPLSTR